MEKGKILIDNKKKENYMKNREIFHFLKQIIRHEGRLLLCENTVKKT